MRYAMIHRFSRGYGWVLEIDDDDLERGSRLPQD